MGGKGLGIGVGGRGELMCLILNYFYVLFPVSLESIWSLTEL